ncbi:EspA/EspE family type VII secretion system effector [Mycolicibacterium hippocampi]|uniref:EspA/EspE family type VII secretion system effector n=1 Tax=Mycolicibacterium hippocampi TaxID=659824 RepID=UPI0035186C57
MVGINWDKGPSILDRTLAPGVANLAASPILAAAQLTIHGMKATTGSGEPQDGEAFKKSADLYEEAGNLLIDAAPKPDRWEGAAAEMYTNTNDAHRRLTMEVAAADREMRSALSRLAAEVKSTRQNLQDAIDFLSDYDTSTAWMNFVPGGAAVKAASDTAVASTQLAVAQASMAKLVAESALVAHSMCGPQGKYKDAGAQKLLESDEQDFPCGEPFGSERKPDRLPRRAKPETTYTRPDPEGPAVIYPPATPYASPEPP